jgi:hypothetical protein
MPDTEQIDKTYSEEQKRKNLSPKKEKEITKKLP